MEPMKKLRKWTGIAGLMAGLAGALVSGGCAPKKVMRTPEKVPVRAPEPVVPKPADPVPELQLGIRAANLAREQLNKPYQWGAEGPEEFDCSGLVYFVYGSLGKSLPRVTHDQAKVGRRIELSALQPGDLVCFITKGRIVNHVGIFIGHSRFIHAPSRHSPVRYDSLNNAWWRRRFQYGRRISG